LSIKITPAIGHAEMKRRSLLTGGTAAFPFFA